MSAIPLRTEPLRPAARRGAVLPDDDATGDDEAEAAAAPDGHAEDDAFADALAGPAVERATAAAAAPRRPASAAPDEAAWRAWIERIVERDERALAALYDAASARVYGLVLRIVRRPAMAEEVLEDTFWQVWRQAPRYDAARAPVLGWVLAVARSRAIDALRRDGRHQHATLPEDDAHEQLADESPAAADLIDATRGAGQVQAALAALEPRARQLVSLAFFRGLTHDEIAAQMALPLGTVKSLIRRALLQLRKQLAGLEPGA